MHMGKLLARIQVLGNIRLRNSVNVTDMGKLQLEVQHQRTQGKINEYNKCGNFLFEKSTINQQNSQRSPPCVLCMDSVSTRFQPSLDIRGLTQEVNP